MARLDERRRPTIYDVAREANASPASVSLVLNGRWEKQRISPDTAERVEATALRLGYQVNKQARGLRLSRSGLAGMLIPHYRNRFFAGLAECFEATARSLGLCPIVVSTQRDDETELRFVRTLLDQHVEFLFFAGMHDPTRLNLVCQTAQTPCVNLDVPGSAAPSVVTDNRGAAKVLTEGLIAQIGKEAVGRLLFLGGIAGEYATEERILGFRDAMAEAKARSPKSAVLRCGYSAASTRQALRRRLSSVKDMPSAIFVNSITALEGLIQFRSTEGSFLPIDVPIGCFDYDPFAAHLPGKITMMRQDVDLIVGTAFELLKAFPGNAAELAVVPAALAKPGRI
jgi:LacI family fructose operon transcriptional repressor